MPAGKRSAGSSRQPTCWKRIVQQLMSLLVGLVILLLWNTLTGVPGGPELEAPRLSLRLGPQPLSAAGVLGGGPAAGLVADGPGRPLQPASLAPTPRPTPAQQLREAALRAAPQGAPGKPMWVFCAAQWQECFCLGDVRWGNDGKWKDIPLKPGETEQKLKCSIDALPDVAPGDDRKHCECAVTPGTPAYEGLNPALLPADSPRLTLETKVADCTISEAGAISHEMGAQHWKAYREFCLPAAPEAGEKAIPLEVMQSLADAWVDQRFKEPYDRVFGPTGWADRVFMNHFAGPPAGEHSRMTEQLVRSIHLFSAMPVVVMNFGMYTPDHWRAKFNRLILMHAAPFPSDHWRSFHFNKLRAMLHVRARVVVQLDSDQFVAPGIDALFTLTEKEVTEEYAKPILPVHFLDRNPKDYISVGNKVKYWHRHCPEKECLYQTLRWGHAHPTWTFWALPWVALWMRRNLRDETLQSSAEADGPSAALRVLDVPEDEDLLNVGMWEDKATKQWCKFDVPGPGDFGVWLSRKRVPDVEGERRFHPAGAPKVFWTCHGSRNPEESAQWIDKIVSRVEAGDLPPPVAFKGKLYADGVELRREHPEVTCLI